MSTLRFILRIATAAKTSTKKATSSAHVHPILQFKPSSTAAFPTTIARTLSNRNNNTSISPSASCPHLTNSCTHQRRCYTPAGNELEEEILAMLDKEKQEYEAKRYGSPSNDAGANNVFHNAKQSLLNLLNHQQYDATLRMLAQQRTRDGQLAESALRSLLEVFVRVKDVEMAEKVFNALGTKATREDVDTLLTLFAKNKATLPKALELFASVGTSPQLRHLKRDISLYNFILAICCAEGEAQVGLSLSNRIQKEGLQPNSETIRYVMQLFVLADKYAAAEQLFNNIRAGMLPGLRHDEHLYDTFLWCMHKANRPPHELVAFLLDMRKGFLQKPDTRNSIKLEEFLKKESSITQQAEQLQGNPFLAQRLTSDGAPDPKLLQRIYSFVMSRPSLRRNRAVVQAIFDLAKEDGVEPNVIMLATLVFSYATAPPSLKHRYLDQVLQIETYARNKGFLNTYVVASLMMYHTALGDTDKAVSLCWEALDIKGTTPSNVLFTAYMYTLMKEGNLQGMIAGYKHMTSHNLQPTPALFKGILRHIQSSFYPTLFISDSYEKEAALRFFTSEMSRYGMAQKDPSLKEELAKASNNIHRQYTIESLNTMLKSIRESPFRFDRYSRFYAQQMLLKNSLEHGVMPTIETFEILVSTVEKHGSPIQTFLSYNCRCKEDQEAAAAKHQKQMEKIRAKMKAKAERREAANNEEDVEEEEEEGDETDATETGVESGTEGYSRDMKISSSSGGNSGSGSNKSNNNNNRSSEEEQQQQPLTRHPDSYLDSVTLLEEYLLELRGEPYFYEPSEAIYNSAIAIYASSPRPNTFERATSMYATMKENGYSLTMHAFFKLMHRIIAYETPVDQPEKAMEWYMRLRRENPNLKFTHGDLRYSCLRLVRLFEELRGRRGSSNNSNRTRNVAIPLVNTEHFKGSMAFYAPLFADAVNDLADASFRLQRRQWSLEYPLSFPFRDDGRGDYLSQKLQQKQQQQQYQTFHHADTTSDDEWI